MTNAEIDRLLELEGKATPASDGGVSSGAFLDFTAAARNALRPLCEEVKRLRLALAHKTARANELPGLTAAIDCVGWQRDNLHAVLTKLVDRADASGPVSAALLVEAREALDYPSTPLDRAVRKLAEQNGRDAAIADVRAYLHEEIGRLCGAGDHEAAGMVEAIEMALERGDHEGAAKQKAGT